MLQTICTTPETLHRARFYRNLFISKKQRKNNPRKKEKKDHKGQVTSVYWELVLYSVWKTSRWLAKLFVLAFGEISRVEDAKKETISIGVSRTPKATYRERVHSLTLSLSLSLFLSSPLSTCRQKKHPSICLFAASLSFFFLFFLLTMQTMGTYACDKLKQRELESAYELLSFALLRWDLRSRFGFCHVPPEPVPLLSRESRSSRGWRSLFRGSPLKKYSSVSRFRANHPSNRPFVASRPASFPLPGETIRRGLLNIVRLFGGRMFSQIF